MLQDIVIFFHFPLKNTEFLAEFMRWFLSSWISNSHNFQSWIQIYLWLLSSIEMSLYKYHKCNDISVFIHNLICIYYFFEKISISIFKPFNFEVAAVKHAISGLLISDVKLISFEFISNEMNKSISYFNLFEILIESFSWSFFNLNLISETQCGFAFLFIFHEFTGQQLQLLQ